MLIHLWNMLLLAAGWLLLARADKQVNVIEGVTVSGIASDAARVSVIIPARNEADNLKLLLPLLHNQTLSLHELIVVDDSSVDQTAEVAAALGARVVQAGALPAGWLGKPWACWRGAAAATGDVFIFLDADTRPFPHFAATVAQLCMEHKGLVTIQPYHNAPTVREQACGLFNAVVLAASGWHAPVPLRKSAFGPCAACSRSVYRQSGGHERVRHCVLEHQTLGAYAANSGMHVSGVRGEGLLHFRMYEAGGWKAMSAGWAKSLALGAGGTPIAARLLVAAWLAGSAGAAVQLLLALASQQLWMIMPAALVYFAAAALIYRNCAKAGSFTKGTAAFYPVYLLYFMLVFGYSYAAAYWLRKVSWKGRTIHVD